MNALTTPREIAMSLPNDPAVVSASVTGILFGIAMAFRYGIKMFFRDRVDNNANSATNDVIQTLRSEVGRLAISVSELSRVNVEVRDERDRLRTEVSHLTYAVNSIKDVLVEILGEEETLRKLKERGIERKTVPLPNTHSNSVFNQTGDSQL